ncbi:hypothetical protein SUGI_0249780 [Cryptomeria japonica]|nr:hypothetical protein SUGI_0249780 [Cryptomeria japonica]
MVTFGGVISNLRSATPIPIAIPTRIQFERTKVKREKMESILEKINTRKNVDEIKREMILPPPQSQTAKTIVLDLDNTLINATFSATPSHYDFTVLVEELQEQPALCYVQKRPAVDNLLLQLAKTNFEIIIFTSAAKEYADDVLNKLDVHNSIKHRLYRDSCSRNRGIVYKDLSKLGRDLKNVILVDDNPQNYKMQPENALPIRPFYGDLSDRELWKVMEFCNMAAKCEDVREAITIHYDVSKTADTEIQSLRERERERERPVSLFGLNWNLKMRSFGRRKQKTKAKTIVLGLFDVLIKASLEPLQRNDFIICAQNRPYHVMKRPGVDNFLSELAKIYEVVVFTEAPKKDADVFLDKFDVNRYIDRRLYRDSPWTGKDHVKSLSKGTLKCVLDVDLKDVIVVDHEGVGYKFEKENGFLVKRFEGDVEDGELYEVLEICKAAAGYEDVREFRRGVPIKFRSENRPQKRASSCTVQ